MESGVEIFSDIFSASTHVLTRDKVQDFINAVIANDQDSVTIQDHDSLDMMFRARHDSVHMIVCRMMSIEFGEKKIEDVFPDYKPKDFDDSQAWELIKAQTPDMILQDDTSITLFDVAVTSAPRRRTRPPLPRRNGSTTSRSSS